MNEALKEFGRRGQEKRLENEAPSVEDILAGMSRSGTNPEYPLKMLWSLFESERAKLPFKLGDTVRIKRRLVPTVDNGGFAGYGAMFHDEVATVVDIYFGAFSRKEWFVTIQYENAYKYSTYTKDFFVNDNPTQFTFSVDYLKKVKNEVPKKDCHCC